MKKPVVMLVDTDEKYLMAIELRIIEELEDNVELMVVSDMEYLQEYFNSPRQIDILIINENQYSLKFSKHNIGNIFILTEGYNRDDFDGENINIINKYTSVKEIYNRITNIDTIKRERNDKDTQTILVYSPIGGVGKTTVALGLAAAMKKSNKKALYINFESIQSFDFLINDMKYCKNGIEKLLIDFDNRIIEFFDEIICTNQISYVTPFRQVLSSIGIGSAEIKFLIDKIKETKIYDYIIIDSSNEFNMEKSMLMGYCNKVIILSDQTRVGAIKLNRLISNIDISNTSKYVFICNKYEPKENYLIKNNFNRNLVITEYIDYIKEEMIDLNYLSENLSFNKLAYLFV